MSRFNISPPERIRWKAEFTRVAEALEVPVGEPKIQLAGAGVICSNAWLLLMYDDRDVAKNRLCFIKLANSGRTYSVGISGADITKSAAPEDHNLDLKAQMINGLLRLGYEIADIRNGLGVSATDLVELMLEAKKFQVPSA